MRRALSDKLETMKTSLRPAAVQEEEAVEEASSSEPEEVVEVREVCVCDD